MNRMPPIAGTGSNKPQNLPKKVRPSLHRFFVNSEN